MAVYNLDGTEITSAYAIDGTSLSGCYDINGNPVGGTEPSEEYSIDNVVAYHQAETLSVAEDIKALGDEWQSFVFVTDIHALSNEQHSQAIALYLLLNTPCQMLVLNGDFCNMPFYTSEYNTYMDVLKPYKSMIYPTFGNHEAYTGGDGYAVAYERIYLDWLYGKSEVQSANRGRIYYYVDYADKKTRYVFINTSDAGNQSLSATQLAWLADAVTVPDSTWSVVVIGHVNLDTLGGMTSLNCGNEAEVRETIATCNGSLVGYFCGHQHIDDTRNVGEFWHTTLLCDMLDNRNTYSGYSLTDRVAGTTSDQAVTVVSINTTTKEVVMRRVGAGRQRTLSYTYA